MARFYGPDAGEHLQARKLRGNKPPRSKLDWTHAKDCCCKYCNARKEERTCENCGRETEFLFDGLFREKVWYYDDESQPIGYVERATMSQGMVCFRCRPPSNLEVKEILKECA